MDLQDMSLEDKDKDEEDRSPRADYGHPIFTMRIHPQEFPPLTLPSNFLYRHTRSLRAIETNEPLPQRHRNPLPSCGKPLDGFLQAMGYNDSAWRRIYEALTTSNSMGNFVRQLQPHGVPAIEAKYMWWAFEHHPPCAGDIALIHIM